ncbi:RpiB/LacA/LacB family sugar-phosphate isomerase [Draconibacterium sediminis]|uniref:RpiB/LacA/LacB family sugar-phosphate isomerase n=1 Tax=Draconibacterium sediminis TaxID=1544798 RepID=UPI0018DC41FD
MAAGRLYRLLQINTREFVGALCRISLIAKLAREHDNTNVLCILGRFLIREEGIEFLLTFFEIEFK